jgi:hypothetical protein
MFSERRFCCESETAADEARRLFSAVSGVFVWANPLLAVLPFAPYSDL